VTRLALELGTLENQRLVVRIEPFAIQERIGEALADWQGSIRKHVPQARSMLRKLLQGRLTVTPEERDGVPGFRFTGKGTLQDLLTGWLPDLPQAVACPTGAAPFYVIGRWAA